MDDIKINEHAAWLINQIPLDLRVEVVIADLLKAGITLDDYFVQPVGIFKRRFNKDIHEVKKVELNNGSDIYNILINREGFYDMLPQGLFHNPPGKGTKPFKKAAEMADEVKVRKAEEKQAREFFAIYEMELYQQRLSIEWNERNLIETMSITMDDDEFLSYWELPPVFDKIQKGILFYLFPIIEKIRGNMVLMEKTYQLILGEEIRMYQSPSVNSTADCVKGNNIIGKKRLGLDLVLGTSSIPVYKTLIIEVGPVANLNLVNFLSRGRCWKIVNELNRFFLLVFMDNSLKVVAQENGWKLGSEKGSTRLGLNVTI